MNNRQKTSENSIATVCGDPITNPEKYPFASYQGKQIYFCTRACLRAFEADPDRFIAGEIEHPMEDD